MLSVVGIGPGSLDLMTERARARILRADVIMGNVRYIELIKDVIPASAEVVIGRMGTEVERAKKAVELGQYKDVVLVSGGDAGIYGMAGLAIEVAADSDTKLEIVPGITAASASAALLGAPISNDFAVVSLSDLLVPWSEIERKLEGLAQMDIAVVVYNPKSKNRTVQLEKTCGIFMQFRDRKTIVGIVRNAEREGCEIEITRLEDLPAFYRRIDMSTTIIIGCSGTKILGGRMVTRRGYETKYDYETGNGNADDIAAGYVEAGNRVWEKSKAIVRDIVSKYPGSLSDIEKRVAGRVVFANADPSFLDLLVFNHHPVETGIRCIKKGKTIITDIEMVKAGISKKYRKNVQCFVNAPNAMEIAKREGLTRTAAGIRLAKELIPSNVVVIGNAPSACQEICALVEEGDVKPALIVATPVGFVNAAEMKEKILSMDNIPCIVIRGPRGGTPSAVAIINELVELGNR
ncbi:precorrin-3B C17-methyltransferase [ANME-1 cluster archaeon GoMg1]|nr:precorrin-3B C17-methyltransferase [ANME-1 cluster archaeon GoMg1]VUT26256.1 MAG: Uroporphyrinogen-III C-methyltransferase [Candidatus Methanolliviera sp. GoM_asphalt]